MTKASATTLVAVGASNLSRGLPALAAAAACRTAGPWDLFVAAGHGRSYGANSRVWMRRLPSILWCGLWRALDRETTGGGVHAVITDVGNDLMYGFSVEQVADWVRETARRLAERRATIAMTRLPLESVGRVGETRYRVLRTLYVPGCTLSLGQLKNSAHRLDAALVGIAHEHGAAIIDQPGDWYGIDAIHLRRRSLHSLWEKVCDAWGLPPSPRPPRVRLRDWAAIGSRAAEVRMVAGLPRFTPQPCAIHRARSCLWLY